MSFRERSSSSSSYPARSAASPSPADVAREAARVRAERFDAAQAALSAARRERDRAADHLRRARRAVGWTTVSLTLCVAQVLAALVHSVLRLDVLNVAPLWGVGSVGTVALTIVLLCVLDHYAVVQQTPNRARRDGVDVTHVAPVVALRDRETDYELAQNAVLNAVTLDVAVPPTSGSSP